MFVLSFLIQRLCAHLSSFIGKEYEKITPRIKEVSLVRPVFTSFPCRVASDRAIALSSVGSLFDATNFTKASDSLRDDCASDKWAQLQILLTPGGQVLISTLMQTGMLLEAQLSLLSAS